MNNKNETTSVQWQPGMDFTSEAHYNKVAKELAQSMLQDNSLEQIALIAAHHIIFKDALDSEASSLRTTINQQSISIELLKSEIELLKTELESMLSVQEAAKYARLALNAYNKKRSKKANQVRHDPERTGKSQALKDWDAMGHHFSSRRAFARKKYRDYGVIDPDSVYRWLLKERPEK